jgi:hypothetical protein
MLAPTVLSIKDFLTGVEKSFKTLSAEMAEGRQERNCENNQGLLETEGQIDWR